MNVRNIDRRLLTILLIVFVQMVGAAMILPILPLYAKREFALTPQAITLLVSSFFAAQFLAGPFLGRLSDQYGRLPILVVSQFGTALSFWMLGAAWSYELLFAARILDGITGGNIIVAQAYITDITPREKRTESLGYVFAIFGLGFIIGPALGGILSAAFGPRIPYYIAAGAALLTALASWVILEETVTDEQKVSSRVSQRAGLSPAEIVRNVPLLIILVIAFVGQFGFGLLQSTFALYGEAVLFAGYSVEMTNLGVGLLLAAVGVGQFITQVFLLRPALEWFGERWLVIIGNVIRAASMYLFAVITTPLLGTVGAALFAVGMGVLMPSLQSLATDTVDDSVRGGVLGIYQSINSLAIIGSTAIAGIIFAMSPTMPFWIGAALTSLAILPALMLLREPAPQEETESTVGTPATDQSPL